MRSLDVARVRALVAALTREDLADVVDLRLVDADEPCDLRVISRGLRRPDEAFVALWQERYVVALPRDHALARHKALQASQLAGARLVARCHCEHAARFAGAGQRFDVVAVAPTEEWALALVAAGVGLAILPEGVARRDPAIVLRPLRDRQARREVGLAYGAGAAPELQRVIDALRAGSGTAARRRPRAVLRSRHA